MYKVVKSKGYNAVVSVENVEKEASIIIGRVSMRILNILERYDITFGGDGDPVITDEWDIVIPESAKDELVKEAMTITAPDRSKDKKKKEPVEEQPKKAIDAMDVLFGLASYED